MKAAPEFNLQDQDGKTHSLKDYKGKWVVLYFYPKDDTPGCTKEACSFRDERSAIEEYGNAVVLGISKDSVASHKKFSDKYKLNFTLLSDESHETIEAYGAWGPKKFMGKEYVGISRNTYLINPDGMIAKEYLGVDPKKHAAEIIKDLQTFQSV
jgi:peroxiredoxin Q/BCP